jgi:site-specific DNA-methyltransferase (adenine-specific)
MISEVACEDNMIMMARYPDKFFDLAIVDPMYIMPENYLKPGSEISTTGIKRKHNKQASDLSKLGPTGYDYFNELRRVSKNQIIWGINYYPFASEICGRIVWDKKNDSSSFSHAEIAACSSILGVRIFRYMWNGMLQENMKDKEIKIHAFQKPVSLYCYCLNNYAKRGNKILDTHLGSGSSRIAAYDLGFDFYGCELDKDYYEVQEKRFKTHISQQKLFTPEQQKTVQLTII